MWLSDVSGKFSLPLCQDSPNLHGLGRIFDVWFQVVAQVKEQNKEDDEDSAEEFTSLVDNLAYMDPERLAEVATKLEPEVAATVLQR